MSRKLKLVVHGEWGSGKSTLGDTAPGPRLILDAEGGVQDTPSRKIEWDPRLTIPELGPDDSAVVTVYDVDALNKVHQWITQADHPFKSIIVDSLTEVQMRLKRRIKPPGQRMMQNDWGELTDRTMGMIETFRDYTLGVHPVDVVVLICGTAEKGAEHPVLRPMLQGSAAEKILGQVDVGTYLSVEQTEEGGLVRRALFVGVDGVAAKARSHKLSEMVTMDDPTIPKILDAMEKE